MKSEVTWIIIIILVLGFSLGVTALDPSFAKKERESPVESKWKCYPVDAPKKKLKVCVTEIEEGK